MPELHLEPLTAAAFAPFGDVIDASRPGESVTINEGRTQRHDGLARIDCDSGPRGAGISLFRAEPVQAPFALRALERHPLASQAFINTGGNRFAIVVAPAGDLDERAIRGFLAGPGQSINYHRGTWHHYLLALDGPSDFIVVDRLDAAGNCDEQALRQPLTLVLDR